MFGLFPPLFLAVALGEGIDAGPRQVEVVRVYECALGKSFSVRFHAKRATVETPNHRYELTRRPFSLGPRYGSDTVAFALDDDRAVLLGADDGPYRDCLEAGADPEKLVALIPSASCRKAGHTDRAIWSGDRGGLASDAV